MNNTSGTVELLDCENIDVVGDPDHLIAALGVKNVCVIHIKNVTLVFSKEKRSDIKKFILEKLKDSLDQELLMMIINNLENDYQ
jgi:hypothetical protein